MVKAFNFQTYNYNGFSFFTIRDSYTDEPLVQVFKEVTDKYGKDEEKLIDTIPNLTSKKISMMSDKDIDKLISKYI